MQKYNMMLFAPLLHVITKMVPDWAWGQYPIGQMVPDWALIGTLLGIWHPIGHGLVPYWAFGTRLGTHMHCESRKINLLRFYVQESWSSCYFVMCEWIFMPINSYTDKLHNWLFLCRLNKKYPLYLYYHQFYRYCAWSLLNPL